MIALGLFGSGIKSWYIEVVSPCVYLQWLCTTVAVLLHYFFLAVFCWMLCEGVMLYLMMVVVFSRLSKRRWFFLLLGCGKLYINVGLYCMSEAYIFMYV